MTVTIAMDQTQACSSVSLIDDNLAEGTQTFSLSIQSASPPAMFDSSEMVLIEIMNIDGMLDLIHIIDSMATSAIRIYSVRNARIEIA